MSKPRLKLYRNPVRIQDNLMDFQGYVIGVWDTGSLCVRWDSGHFSKSAAGFHWGHFTKL